MDGHELILRFIVICGMFVDIVSMCQLFVGTNLIKEFLKAINKRCMLLIS